MSESLPPPSSIAYLQTLLDRGEAKLREELGRFVLVGSPAASAKGKWSFATQTIEPGRGPGPQVPKNPLAVEDTIALPVRKRGVTFADTIFVGRARSNDLCVDHDTVSKLHARITLEDDFFLVEDAGSHNGTFVEGDRVTVESSVYPGDLVRFGSCTFEVYEADRFVSLLRRL